jgi:hypothetical protein
MFLHVYSKASLFVDNYILATNVPLSSSRT